MKAGIAVRAAALVAGAGLIAGGCGSAATSDDATTVIIRTDGSFDPAAARVVAGATVVFENHGTHVRDVVADDVESARILARDFWAVTLDRPGTYTIRLADDDARLAVIEAV